ncbi:MAG TPA: outer membrane protein assembly factor BamD [Gemmatimonadales bacterium]|nr:outer membrane protein assembly factor BamD [Gemmatimonadales bacterium]
MLRRTLCLLALLGTAACAGGRRSDATQPAPLAGSAERIPQTALDSIWTQGEHAYRRGKWSDAGTLFERFLLEAGPGDGRITRARFYIGETKLAQGQRLEAARDFRRVSDETPNDPLAPDALLRVGDAYAELWRRPELDPSYGQTALATYQELVSRYPDSPAAQRAQGKMQHLQDWFAFKQYKSALYYLRLKAYDSAILYLKDLVATYPRAQVAPDALVKLVEAYRVLGYSEDAAETCGYLRRFHPKANDLDKVCQATPAKAS